MAIEWRRRVCTHRRFTRSSEWNINISVNFTNENVSRRLPDIPPPSLPPLSLSRTLRRTCVLVMISTESKQQNILISSSLLDDIRSRIKMGVNLLKQFFGVQYIFHGILITTTTFIGIISHAITYRLQGKHKLRVFVGRNVVMCLYLHGSL